MTLPMFFLVLGLLLANGFFVGAEFALIAARRSKIEHLANEGDRRAKIALKSIRELSLMLAGAQLGITMASLGLGAVAEPAIARSLESVLEPLAIPSGLLHTISFVIALTIVVFFHMVVGEMAPKNIAIAKPEASALWLAAPLRTYAWIFRPFIALLNALANQTLRLLGVEPKDELLAVHTAEEIGVMVRESAKEGVLHDFEHRLLSGAAHFGEEDAGSVMIPRTEVVALPFDTTPAEIEQKLIETGHSRYPLYRDNLDNIVGFVHVKDLMQIPDGRRDKPLSPRFVRPMLLVPESRKAHPLLLDMKLAHRHFSVVLDEHGGTAGIVTLEDLLEELVGEIFDEYDTDRASHVRLGDGRYLLPGITRLHEAQETIGIRLPEGEYDTIAGFLMDRLGRIPKRLDKVTHEGWSISVRRMKKRSVAEVLVERQP